MIPHMQNPMNEGDDAVVITLTRKKSSAADIVRRNGRAACRGHGHQHRDPLGHGRAEGEPRRRVHGEGLEWKQHARRYARRVACGIKVLFGLRLGGGVLRFWFTSSRFES